MIRTDLLLTIAALCARPTSAAPPSIDRSIHREPTYQTKSPKYGQLVFGPEGRDRVWLVRDGDTLYVDRNGNGDLTGPGKKIPAERSPGRDSANEGYSFSIGDVKVGGRTHKHLAVSFIPLKLYADAALGKRADVRSALAKDPKALAASLQVDVEVSGLKSDQPGGLAVFSAGPIDLAGVLQFADTPADAPIVHCGGPLQITFYAELPTLRVGRGSELDLVVGTAGVGPGTFAMLGYEGTIPKSAKPMAEMTLPPAKAGAAPIKEIFEVKERC